MRIHFLLILCSAVILSACEKDGDLNPPQVTILSPSSGTSFMVTDTILVRIRVTDDVNIESVSAQLTDNGIAVSERSSLMLNQPEAEVILPIEIDRIQLPTNNYTIAVRASDGTNDDNAFRSVFVQEIPLAFKGLIAVTEVSGNVNVHRTDSAFNSTVISTMQLNGTVGTMNSFHQQFIIGGGVTGDLVALDAGNGSVLWSVPNLGIGTLPYFWDARFVREDLLVYVLDELGNIRGRNETGLTLFNATSSNGHRPLRGWVINDRFVSLEESTAGAGFQLATYFKPSGVTAGVFPMDKDVIEIFPRQGSEGVLFGNRQLFDSQFGPGFEPRDIPGEPIAAVVQITNDLYIVATPSAVYRYTYTNNNLLPIAAGMGIRDMDYDLITGAVYAATGSQVLALDPSNGNSTIVSSFGEPVQRVFVVQNK